MQCPLAGGLNAVFLFKGFLHPVSLYGDLRAFGGFWGLESSGIGV